jgi:uncharacterized membrane protein
VTADGAAGAVSTEDDEQVQSDANDPADAAEPPTQAPTPEEESLGWRGWVLVGALVVAFVVVPWTIILVPSAGGALGATGIGWRDAYLVLPLVPALGLGVLAVWVALANRRA